jgi:hypothetical protein
MMASLTIDFGRTAPVIGLHREKLPDGSTATVQINCGLFALLWMPLSMSALMAEWMQQSRRLAWDAVTSGITIRGDEMQELSPDELEALIEEGENGR